MKEKGRWGQKKSFTAERGRKRVLTFHGLTEGGTCVFVPGKGEGAGPSFTLSENKGGKNPCENASSYDLRYAGKRGGGGTCPSLICMSEAEGGGEEEEHSAHWLP